ncbi:hypothetical protein BOTBODRAFT_28927 [Botryobasidium botryosum FD-172 SS1]|uniref:Enoyl reductase (ER) domain-containing protein n=1 Tax=Botryobasidium botryosum (strain FD-172 SS1) TaxID=930990 RepID=A0A067MV06_BOTB1|nr:hypothetical protein BOTBODRAFT_28927 [Botryobasidium botryosum FD-172 SS1]
MATPAGTTQKAWRVVRRGSPSQALKFQNDLPIPTPSPGSVLVKIQAAALNPVGYKLMKLLPNLIAGRPHVTEHDVAGVIANGNGTEFKEGDSVLGLVDNSKKQGALAQYAVIPAEGLVHIPPTLSLAQAAGLSLVGLTAVQGLVDILHIKAGQRIFINGGSSAVGALAIQIAKTEKCHVTTSCSGGKIEGVKSLGADEILDYTASPLWNQLSSATTPYQFDAIFDAVGTTALFTHSKAYLSPKGTYVSIVPEMNGVFGTLWGLFETSCRPTWLGGTPRTFKFFSMKPSKKNLQYLADLAREGKLTVPVDSEYAMEDTLKAYERLMTGHANGKVVVNITH